MPIKIQDDLPAKSVLEDEHIFVMTETRALSQDIRPLKIVILNLMPTKIETIRRCRLRLRFCRQRPMSRRMYLKSI